MCPQSYFSVTCAPGYFMPFFKEEEYRGQIRNVIYKMANYIGPPSAVIDMRADATQPQHQQAPLVHKCPHPIMAFQLPGYRQVRPLQKVFMLPCQ